MSLTFKTRSVRSIFLDNVSIKQTIFKNTFWLGTAEVISRLLRLVLLIYVAKILGATEYGRFTFALSFVSLFVVVHDFGLPLVVTREFAGKKEREPEFYSVLSLKIVLSGLVSLLVLSGSFLVTSDPVVRRIILVLALFSVVSGFLTVIYAFFQARQRMEYQAWTIILQASVLTPVGILALWYFPSVLALSYSYLLSAVVALVVVLHLFHFRVLPLKLLWRTAVMRKFLNMAWPMALIGLSGIIYTYIDSVMLGYWGFITETGWYNAAYSIIHVLLVPAGLLSTSVYPVVSRFFRESDGKLHDALQVQTRIMIVVAFPLVVGGIALAREIILYVYGVDFSPSILAFQILVVIAGFVFLGSPLQNLFLAANQQKVVLYVNVFGAALNIALNLLLIPQFTLYGAATATLITYITMFGLIVVTAKFYVRVVLLTPQVLKTLASAVISTGLMFLVIRQSAIADLNILLSVAVGATVYLTAFALTHSASTRWIT